MRKKRNSRARKPLRKKGSIFKQLIFFFGIVVLIILGSISLPFFKPAPVSQVNCANSISCIRDLSGRYESGENSGTFMGRSVSAPSYIAQNSNVAPVLGESTGSNKHIYIDLSSQRLYAFEGNNLVYNFLVSTGKWGKTPTGDFNIWIKLRYTRMTGGNRAIGTYYDLPNVPFTMYLYNSAHSKSEGYGIHGAYWHNNFGHPMSHGCINMRPSEAEQLYYWANPPSSGNVTYATADNPSTPVTIYGTAPVE